MSDLLTALTGFGLWIGSIAAWITSIVHGVKTDGIAMLIVDIMIPPVGVIHGLIIWFT